jgi:hypothetical protein
MGPIRNSGTTSFGAELDVGFVSGLAAGVRGETGVRGAAGVRGAGFFAAGVRDPDARGVGFAPGFFLAGGLPDPDLGAFSTVPTYQWVFLATDCASRNDNIRAIPVCLPATVDTLAKHNGVSSINLSG